LEKATTILFFAARERRTEKSGFFFSVQLFLKTDGNLRHHAATPPQILMAAASPLFDACVRAQAANMELVVFASSVGQAVQIAW